LPDGRGFGAGRQGKDSAMAWQRSLCIGVCLVGFAAVVQAEEAATTVSPIPALSDKPRLVKTQSSGVKSAKAHPRAKRKAAAGTVKAGTRGHPAGQVGYASWYGGERHGKRMAGGGKFDKDELTAAHRTLPLHSNARVTNMANGRTVMVRITDRGPSRKGRIIDLSQSAAEQIGMKRSGVARVQVEPMQAEMSQ
jgi:rare lipoprotein A